MGQSSLGQQLSSFNQKKGVTIGQVVVQTSENKMTEVIVVFGNYVYPQLWNKAIIEVRSTDTDRSLNSRRFFIKGDDNILDTNFPNKQIDSFTLHVLENPQQYDETEKFNGEFAFIAVPLCVQVNEPQSVNHSYSEQHRQQIILSHPYSDLEGIKATNYYREEYIAFYMNAFEKLQAEPFSDKKVSVGILDMRPNNPVLGIDNYQMTSDILQAFVNIKPNIEKLIFVTEDEKQAMLMGSALQNKAKEMDKLTLSISEHIEMEIPLGEIKDDFDGNKPQVNNDESIQLNEMHNSPLRIIKRPAVISYENGHVQCVTHSYFRDLSKRIPQGVLTTILPRIDSTIPDFCLCGRNTTIRNVGNWCCYCRQQRPTYFTCEQRACGRSYCSSCLRPNKTYYQCYKGHTLQRQPQNVENENKCSFCLTRVFKIGLWGCQMCQFYVCGYCYFSSYADWIYTKFKMYSLALKQLKPYLRKEVQYELLLEYLMDMDMEKVWKQH